MFSEKIQNKWISAYFQKGPSTYLLFKLKEIDRESKSKFLGYKPLTCSIRCTDQWCAQLLSALASWTGTTNRSGGTGRKRWRAFGSRLSCNSTPSFRKHVEISWSSYSSSPGLQYLESSKPLSSNYNYNEDKEYWIENSSTSVSQLRIFSNNFLWRNSFPREFKNAWK